MKKKKFTGIHDSYGNKLYEGDRIEYFVFFPSVLITGKQYNDGVNILEITTSDTRYAFDNGFTCAVLNTTYRHFQEGKPPQKIKRVLFYKPTIGVVEWSKKYHTYKPLFVGEDFTSPCFAYTIKDVRKHMVKHGDAYAYCKSLEVDGVISTKDESIAAIEHWRLLARENKM